MSSNPAMDVTASIVKVMEERPELFQSMEKVESTVEKALKIYVDNMRPRVMASVMSKAKAMGIEQ